MELDDLRRQWQQPAPADLPALNPRELDGLLAQRSGSLIEKMQRNARLEMAYTTLFGLATPLILLQAQNPLLKAEAVLLLVLVLVMLRYYYRKLKMLGQMTRADTNVRESLVRLCSGIREMLRFYYRLSLWAGPWTLVLMYGYYVSRALARGEVFSTKMLSFGAGMFIGGGLMQIVIVYATRWFQQRLYGRHLDRLEANLRELDEPGPVPPH
ncbi:hypothetical protein GCM10022409_12290 [Hymenobacter glaciei]|uniref:Uncharacterized protein n=1 Tax=Hymenobacter glaciei TaxID=877209 RepID=A0ABP7TQ94_9BACT